MKLDMLKFPGSVPPKETWQVRLCNGLLVLGHFRGQPANIIQYSFFGWYLTDIWYYQIGTPLLVTQNTLHGMPPPTPPDTHPHTSSTFCILTFRFGEFFMNYVVLHHTILCEFSNYHGTSLDPVSYCSSYSASVSTGGGTHSRMHTHPA